MPFPKYVTLIIAMWVGGWSLFLSPRNARASCSRFDCRESHSQISIPKAAFFSKSNSVSLSDVLALARERHVNIILANERVQQALAQIGQARSSFLPQLTSSISQKRQTRNLESSGISLPNQEPTVGPFNAYDARVKFTQTLFDLAAFNRFKAAAENHQLSLAQSREARQDVLALAAHLFIEARRAGEQLSLAQVLADRARLHLAVARNRFESGQGALQEFNRGQVEYKKSLYFLERMKTLALEKRLDLGAALGVSFAEDVVFDPLSVEERKIFDDVENSFGGLNPDESGGVIPKLSSHPQMEAAYQDLRVSKSNLSAQRAEYFPKISLLGDYGPSGVDPNDFSETYTLGAQASFSFWEGGLRESKSREAESLVRFNEAKYNDLSFHLRSKVRIDQQSLIEVKSLIAANADELNVAEQELDLAERRLKNGMGSSLELVDAQAAVATLADQLQEAQAAYILAQIHLARDLGTLDDLFP